MAQTAHMETNVAGRRNDVKPLYDFLYMFGKSIFCARKTPKNGEARQNVAVFGF